MLWLPRCVRLDFTQHYSNLSPRDLSMSSYFTGKPRLPALLYLYSYPCRSITVFGENYVNKLIVLQYIYFQRDITIYGIYSVTQKY